jgi:hypothetical protein
MPKLESWSVIGYPFSPYVAPECKRPCLQGICSGHPHIEDGHSVHTSRLIAFNWEARTARTHSGTHYELGEPAPDFLNFVADKGGLSGYNTEELKDVGDNKEDC